MESKTKTLLEEEKIRQVVSRQFGPQASLVSTEELKGGMFNSAYLLKVENGRCEGPEEMVLKAAVAPGTKILTYEQEIMKTEVKIYDLLKDTGVPLPGMIAADFSRKDIPCDYFIMERLHGKPWNDVKKQISEENNAGLKYEVGRINAMTHSVKGDYFGYIKDDESFHYKTWSEAFTSMMENIVKDGRKEKIKLPYEECLKAIKRHEKELDKVQVPSLINFDMWAGNIFLAEKGGKYTIEGVVDFERAFYGDPLAEFISAMMIYDDIANEPEIRRGYESVTGEEMVIGESERTRLTLYSLYLHLIMSVETYRYNKVYATAVKQYMKGKIKKFLKAL